MFLHSLLHVCSSSVNTASCVEEVKDFFGIMEAVYRFINASSQ